MSLCREGRGRGTSVCVGGGGGGGHKKRRRKKEKDSSLKGQMQGGAVKREFQEDMMGLGVGGGGRGERCVCVCYWGGGMEGG